MKLINTYICTTMQYTKHLNLSPEKAALMEAIDSNSLKNVKELVKGCGVNPNFETLDMFAHSPIYLAIARGHNDIARWLLSEGGVAPSQKVFEWAHIMGNIQMCSDITALMKESETKK